MISNTRSKFLIQVVLTDYPDDQLVENMKINVENNIPVDIRHRVGVQV